jgi:hypothetical protein
MVKIAVGKKLQHFSLFLLFYDSEFFKAPPTFLVKKEKKIRNGYYLLKPEHTQDKITTM